MCVPGECCDSASQIHADIRKKNHQESDRSTTYLKFPLTGEDADPFVVIVGDDDVTIRVDGHTSRPLQLTGRPAPYTEPAFEQTIVGENLPREHRNK